jgi:hypothetical protein
MSDPYLAAGARGAEHATPDAGPAISGAAYLEHGCPAAGVRIRAYQREFGGAATLVGQADTGPDGRYTLTFQPVAQPVNLDLRTAAPGGGEIPLTDTVLGVRPGDVLNLVVPAAVAPADSEYHRLLTDVTAHLGGQPLGGARQTADQPDLTLLQQNTGWDARLVALAATAEHLDAATGVAAPAAYALLRAGLPASPDGLAGVSPAAVTRALHEAVGAGIVDLDAAAQQDAVAAFTGFARRRRLSAAAPGALSSQGEMLAAAGLSANQAAAFDDIDATVAHAGGTPGDLWSAAAKAGLPVDTLKLVGRLGRLTLNNAPLTRHLLPAFAGHDLGPALASRGLYQAGAWTALLRAAAGPATVSLDDLIPPAFTGATTTDRLQAYAEDLARKVRIGFPTNAVAHGVSTGTIPLPDTGDAERDHTATVLDRAAALGLRLGRVSVSAMLREHGDVLLDGVPAGQRAGVTAAVRTLHRVYQITPTDEAMAALLAAGLHSAYDVTAMPLRTFLARHGDRFASPAEATAVYGKAQQVSGAALGAVTAARQLDSAPPVFALSSSDAAARQAGKDALVETFPTMEQLFGTQDFCACDDCRSVLSPAAYLVDLLHLLDPPAGTLPPGAKAPFEILDRRRPDLAELPLTCENTNTVLPYIDLVTETLEYYVAHGRLAPDAVRDTDDAVSADLIAEPQFLIPAAYDTLRTAVYPQALPFDLWLATVRRLLEHFGSPLWQLLDAFHSTDELYPRSRHRYGQAAVALERLGLSPAELALLSVPDQEARWPELYGYPPGAKARALAELPNAVTLARRLGVSYDELLQLVTCRFVNPALATVAALPKLGLTLTDVLRYQGAPGHAPLTGDERAAVEAALRPAGGPAALAAMLPADLLARMLVLADPNAGCGFETTTLRYADGRPADATVFLLLDHLVRVWRRLGWTLDETDRALSLFLPADPDPRTPAALGPAMASALLGTARLAALTDAVPGDRTELLELWSDLPPDRYAELFLVPGTPPLDAAVFDQPLGRYLEFLDGDAWRPFGWDPTLPEDPATGNVGLAAHAGTVQAALGLAATDVTAILADAGASLDAAALNPATVSLLHRYAVLARRLRLPVTDLITLRQLAGVDPFAAPPSGPVTTPADDHAGITVAFAGAVAAVRSAGVAGGDLDYLLRHRFDPAGPYGAVPAPPLDLIRTLDAELTRIGTEYADPPDPTALGDEELRQKMALVLAADAVDTFLGMWTGTVTYDAVLTGVTLAQALDPALVAGEPTITLRYDPVRGEQHLVSTGVLVDAETDRLLAAFDGTPDQLARYTTLLDSVRATASGFFDATLLAPVGFLATGDYDALFAPLPAGADEAGRQAELAARRQRLIAAFLPFLRDRLTAEAITSIVLGVFASAYQDSEALTTALLAEPELIADRAAPGQPLLDGYRAAGDRGTTATADPTAGTGRVEAYLEVPVAGPYRFTVSCQHAGTTIELRFDHLPDPLLLATTGADGDRPGAAVDLAPGTTYHLVLAAGATSGGTVEVLVLGENLPEGPLDRLVCHPAESVERVRRAHVLLDKALRVAIVAGLAEPELRHVLTHPADFDGLALTTLPVTAQEGGTAPATILFGQVRRLLDHAALRSAIGAAPGNLTDLFADARQTYPADPAAADQGRQAAADALLADVQARVAVLTRRDQPVVAEAFDRLGIAATATATTTATGTATAGGGDAGAGTDAAVAALTNEIGLGRLWTVLALATRTGISPGTLADSATPAPDPTVARRLRDAVRAGYDAAGWRRVAQPIFDALRQQRRDALVAWIMQHDGLTLPDQLYEFFLVDPATEPVVQTSRLRLAISAVQLFIQRCLLNLEPEVPASLIDADRWQWMKRYRLWEANRKIFLWPENWLEPEFRDDKSHLFDALESSLLAGDVTDDLACEALFAYLRGLEPLGHLDIRSVHLEHADDPAGNTLHVLARTFGAPYAYFYRTYRYGMWAPWAPVTAQIDGDHLAAAVWQDRLHLFWVTFLEKGDGTSNDGTSMQQLADRPVDAVRGPRVIDVHLHWAEYHQGTWTQPASGGLDTPVSATVGPEWTTAQQTIHVGRDGDAILIQLSRAYAKEINQAFRLENKNSPPRHGAHHKRPAIPYTTWSPYISGTPTVPIDNPLWVAHTESPGTVTDHILDIGSDWTLCTIDNPVTGDDADAAALADPLFYSDSAATFYIEPAVTETIIYDDGWVIPAVTPLRSFNAGPYWAGLNLLSQAPATAAAAGIAPSPAARFAVTAHPDWATTATTTVDYQGTPITAPVTAARTGTAQ